MMHLLLLLGALAGLGQAPGLPPNAVAAHSEVGRRDVSVGELAALLRLQSFGGSFDLASDVRAFEFVVVGYRKGKEVFRASSGKVSNSAPAGTRRGDVRLVISDLDALAPEESLPKRWRLLIAVRLGAGSLATTDVPKQTFDFSVLNQGSTTPRGGQKGQSIADSEGRIPLLVVGCGPHPSLPDPLTPAALQKFQQSYEADYFVGYLVVK